MRKSIRLTLIMTLALLVCAWALTPSTSHAVEGDVVKIGLAVPITGHGANVGKREAIGAQAAVNVINATGGVGGVPMEMIIEDTGSSPQEAVNVVRKLTGDEKVLAIVGPHYSSVAEATFPLGNKLKIVQIAVASSKPGVAEANRPYAFRNTLTEDKIADAVVASFKEKYGVEKVAIIVDIKDAVSKSLGTKVLPAAFEAAGIEVINKDKPVTYQTNDTQFTTQITKLKALQPDGIGMGSLGPDALNIITEARRQGMDQPFMGTAPLMEGDVASKGGAAVEGTMAGTIFNRTDTSPGVRCFVSQYKKVQDELYTSEFTEQPDYYPVNAYDAVFMIAEAIEAMGVTNDPKNLEEDRTKIMEYMTDLRDFNGVASRGFNEVGDGIKDVHVFIIEDGEWVPYE